MDPLTHALIGGVLAMVALPLVLTLAVIAWDRWRRPYRGGEGPPLRPGQLLLLAAIAVPQAVGGRVGVNEGSG